MKNPEIDFTKLDTIKEIVMPSSAIKAHFLEPIAFFIGKPSKFPITKEHT